ncbi:MAG TPA: RHS repeat-associated core domain-containing protein, partial [Thermoleophilia bacterium]|nr:RHS repeat-associated core domain-containing protein [Thermoleophilia bacterium]
GYVTRLDYDGLNRPITVTNALTGTTVYQYDKVGNVTGATDPNGQASTYSYDAANRVITATDALSHGTQYGYDEVGNRTVITDANGVATTLAYDYLRRPVAAIDGLSNTTRYEYDAVGNRTVITDANLHVTRYDYDDLYRLSSVTDAAGNTTGYQYDQLGSLKVITDANLQVTRYDYDGDGLRVGKTVAGETTNYLWDKALALPVIITDSNSLYLYGLGLIAQQSGLDVAYYHPDGLDSVRNLTNGSGQGIASYSYDPFGGLRSASGSWPNDFRFTGQQFDQATGLYYLRARYYDPATGRFISRDAFPGYAINPASLHPYSYAENNPTNWVDPSGECPQCLLNAIQTYGPRAVQLAQQSYALGQQLIQRLGPPAVQLAQRGYAAGQQLLQRGSSLAQRTAELCLPRLPTGATGLATKAEARAIAEKMGLSEAQAAAVNAAIRRATTSSTIDVVPGQAGSVIVRVYRAGVDGYQVIESTMRSDGTKFVVQKAYDSAGNLVHYDVKTP